MILTPQGKKRIWDGQKHFKYGEMIEAKVVWPPLSYANCNLTETLVVARLLWPWQQALRRIFFVYTGFIVQQKEDMQRNEIISHLRLSKIERLWWPDGTSRILRFTALQWSNFDRVISFHAVLYRNSIGVVPTICKRGLQDQPKTLKSAYLR